MTGERDNIKAGIFVLLTVALGLVVVIVLGSSTFRTLLKSQQTVKVYYPLEIGLQGLTEGAEVSLGDVKIGTVERISDVADSAQPRRIVGKVATFMVPAEYQLYWNTQVELLVPVLGSATTLNIRSVGDNTPYDPEAPMPQELRDEVHDDEMKEHLPPGALPGNIASSLTRNLLHSLGWEDEQSKQLKNIMTNVSSMSDDLRTKVTSVGKKASSALTRLDEMLADTQTLVRKVNARRNKWLDHLDHITENSDAGTKTLRELIDQNAGQIANMLADLHDLVAGQRPVIERTMANMHLASEQLKLTTIEVRRAPWRLLYEPGKTELETDNLYDSARSFAQAAASVEATVASIRSLDSDSVAAQRLDKLLKYLEALQTSFQKAEEQFWKDLEQAE